MTNILVTTMGTTWQIPPELIGFTNPHLVDLYRFHPRYSEIETTRQTFGIPPVDELWIVTTSGKVEGEIKKIQAWEKALPQTLTPFHLHVWQVADLEDLVSDDDCRRMREAIFRVVLHASKRVGSGKLLLSLAGGRKTMSSDMQTAATWFGCHALIHVIDNNAVSGKLRDRSPQDFVLPLPDFYQDSVTPLVIGQYKRNPLLDLPDKVSAENFEIPFPGTDPVKLSIPISETILVNRIQDLLKNAEHLSVNYSHRLLEDDGGTNFWGLYSLAPQTIGRLKTTQLGVDPEKAESELAWLKRLPKAELHCHLGGVLDTDDLIHVASDCREYLLPYQSHISPWLNRIREMQKTLSPNQFRDQLPFQDLPGMIPGIPEPFLVCAFILLFENDPDLLDQILFGDYRKESDFCAIDFSAYEQLGDIQGSRLLQHPCTIRGTCRLLAKKAKEQNIRHLEIRCSPIKYGRGGLSHQEVMELITSEMNGSGLSYSLILTASRHGNPDDLEKLTGLADRLLNRPEGMPSLKGFDLAGDEKSCPAKTLREQLLPLMEKCLHITIHAGETDSVDSIWQAVYHLNAERIGHGLKLGDNPELLHRFIDKNIAVEMCPSSNFQIVGYRDNFFPSTANLPEYPLKNYLNQGIKVTVNTDNPGISRTDLTHELHRAARLTPGGLSMWDMLRLIRNGFKSAFTDRKKRNELLRKAEKEIIPIILEEDLP